MFLNLFTIVLACMIWNCVMGDGIVSFDKQDTDKLSDSHGIVCLNNQTKCEETHTCCVTKHNTYHCCRYSNAVCCPDKYHCCPSGTTCDTEKKLCIRRIEDPMEWPVVEVSEHFKKKMLKLKPSSTLYGFQEISEGSKMNKDVTCPNNKTKCKDTKTCCITKHGNYYCCPHKNAVCCSDKYNCCPENTKCDLENKKCVNSLQTSDLNNEVSDTIKKSYLEPAIFSTFNLFLNIDKLKKNCANSEQKCPGQKRCCSMANGKYGCCKFDKGVCCPDMKTCCPHDTECDGTKGTCISKAQNLVQQISETKSKIKVKLNNICPDSNTECQSFETCCPVGDGLYGCCPFKNATCCLDLASCCPHDKTCDLKNKVCKHKITSPSSTSNMKFLIHYYNEIGLKVVCPDKSKCGEQDTCCIMEDNQYGCCSYKNGVCCSNKTCCPNGYQCVLGGCEKI